jgi:DnaJ-class molecular chaperone
MSDTRPCSRCDEKGYVEIPSDDPQSGVWDGEFLEIRCADCGGTGRVRERDSEEVYWDRVTAWMERDR